MTLRTLLLLVVLGVLAAAGGWYFGTATTPREQVAVDAGKLMFPDLAPKLRDAAKIEITSQGRTLAIERKGDAWGLADRGGYPVTDTKLRGMLTALTELRLVEPRTSEPEQYHRIGVADPDARDSKSSLLRVLDGAGKPMVSVIVGHRRVRTQAKVPEQVYVRRPGEAQAWLAEGSLQADSDPQLWLDRDIMNIDHNRIARVVATRGDQTLEFTRQNGKFDLTRPAEHPKLEGYRVEDVSRALESLTLQDVQADDKPVGEAVGRGVFTTSDGLTVTASVFRGDKDIWARFTASGDDKAKAEAERLAARLAGWTYQLGSWKEKSLVPTLDDLKAAPEANPAAQAQPGTQDGMPAAPADSGEAGGTASPAPGGSAETAPAGKSAP
jgi:Domain of unknown function (DUF4340)